MNVVLDDFPESTIVELKQTNERLENSATCSLFSAYGIDGRMIHVRRFDRNIVVQFEIDARRMNAEQFSTNGTKNGVDEEPRAKATKKNLSRLAFAGNGVLQSAPGASPDCPPTCE